MEYGVDIIKCESRDEWLRERTKSVGASESPKLLLGSQVEVWASKVNPEAMADEMTERQEIGLGLEEFICRLYQKKYGGGVDHWPQTDICRSQRFPLMHCTPDALVSDDEHDGLGVMQIKTWSEFDRKSWIGEPPLSVQIQVSHEMAVTGLQWGIVAVLFGASELQRFEIVRNERFITGLLAAVGEFWGYVEAEEPPPIDGSYATAQALARLHPDDNGETVELPNTADRLLASLQQAKEDRKRADEDVTRIENQIKAWLGDNTYGVTPGGLRVSWKTQTRKPYSVPEKTFRVLRQMKGGDE